MKCKCEREMNLLAMQENNEETYRLNAYWCICGRALTHTTFNSTKPFKNGKPYRKIGAGYEPGIEWKKVPDVICHFIPKATP